jgi:hypothetical protein
VGDWKEDLLQLSLTGSNFPITLENARRLLHQGIVQGRVHITDHIRQRAVERAFTTVDVERIVKSGNIIAVPQYCEDFANWVFRMQGKCDTRNLEVRVALSWAEDLTDPLVIFITGICKGQAPWAGHRKRKKSLATKKK